jgi:hypothetical protein
VVSDREASTESVPEKGSQVVAFVELVALDLSLELAQGNRTNE